MNASHGNHLDLLILTTFKILILLQLVMLLMMLLHLKVKPWAPWDGSTAPHVAAPHLIQLLACSLGKQQRIAQSPGTLHSSERPTRLSWTLALDWLRSGVAALWVISQRMEDLSVYLSVYLSFK